MELLKVICSIIVFFICHVNYTSQLLFEPRDFRGTVDNGGALNIKKRCVEGENIVPRPERVEKWPKNDLIFNVGQISGVALDPNNDPVILHRGPRVFVDGTFNESNQFQKVNEGPIQEHVVLVLDAETGNVKHKYFPNHFYLPHGITIDRRGGYYITDIAMHQVMRFSPPFYQSSPQLELVIGKAFEPGSDLSRLCMPTSVAVGFNYEIFIADGYCNSRILKFSAKGRLMRLYPEPWEFLNLRVPHSLTLFEKNDLICIADRQNMRIACVNADTREPYVTGTRETFSIQQPDLGMISAVTSSNKDTSNGHLVYATNMFTNNKVPVQGFTVDPKKETVVDSWEIHKTKKIWMPHDIAISRDGVDLYISSIYPNALMKYVMKDSNSSFC